MILSSCEECCEVFGWPEGHYTLDSGKSIRVSCPCDCHSETKEEGDMAQHSLGPWITGTQGGDGRVVYVGADMMFVPGSGPTTKANARLIARAPQLLKIVEFLGEWVKAGADNISLSALFSQDDGGFYFGDYTLADAVWDALKKED